MFQWIKSYLPKSLYGRAALILVLPIVFLQLIVSIVFVQRHFEDVTHQMTSSLVNEVRLLANTIDAQGKDDAQRLGNVLKIAIEPVDPKTVEFEERHRFYDFSGIIVRRLWAL